MPSATAALVALIASSSASFFALHLGLGRRPDADDGHAARQLGQPLLELLAVVVAGRLVDFAPDLLLAARQSAAFAAAADHCGVFLVDDHALGPAEMLRS